MGTFLIASWAGGGNTPGAYQLGVRLQARGHEVHLIGWPEMQPTTRSMGLSAHSYSGMDAWPEGRMHEDDFDELFRRLHGEQVRESIVSTAREIDTDVLVVDCMMRAGFEAAEELSLPTAGLVHMRYAPFRYDFGSGVMQGDVGEIWGRADLLLLLTTASLDDGRELLPNAQYVGPVLPPTSPTLEELGLKVLTDPGDRWVLLSLSSTEQGQDRVLPGLLEQLGRLPVRVLLTTSGLGGSLSLPGNVVARAHVPHPSVLPHVAAVVSHGGLSTVTTSLAYGVPLVLIPQGREQPVNAQRVAELGAGVHVSPDAAPAVVGEALLRVLDDAEIRRAAGRVAAETQALGRGSVATDLVEALAR